MKYIAHFNKTNDYYEFAYLFFGIYIYNEMNMLQNCSAHRLLKPSVIKVPIYGK